MTRHHTTTTKFGSWGVDQDWGVRHDKFILNITKKEMFVKGESKLY